MRIFFAGFFVLCSASFAFGQSDEGEKFRLKGVYAGLDAGTDFQEIYGGANVKFILSNSWMIGFDYFQGGTKTAENLPDDYTDGANLIGVETAPKDYIDSYSILITKRHALSKNTGLVFTLGPNLAYEKTVFFTSKGSGTWYESNYSTAYTTEQGWGVVSKAGVYWTVANWCAFQLELLGNFNKFRNYGALCLSMNFGWLPKEK